MAWLLKLLLILNFNFNLLAIEFQKRKIKFKETELVIEVADTQERLSQGLMDRQTLSENEGMLFIFDDEQIRHFWMKNTFIPLSIGFFNKERVLVDIQDMEPVRSAIEIPKNYSSKKPAKYALEVKRGWFTRNKVRLKSVFNFVETTHPK